MKTIALVLLSIFAISIASAAPAIHSAIAGDWNGVISADGHPLRVIIHVAEDASGNLSATLDSPDQGANGTPMSSIEFHSPDLHFGIEQFGAKYDGTLSADGSQIAGTWKQDSAAIPLNFKRSAR